MKRAFLKLGLISLITLCSAPAIPETQQEPQQEGIDERIESDTKIRDLMRQQLKEKIEEMFKKKKEPPYFSKNVDSLTYLNFDKKIKESKLPVIVDFYISHCGPCKEMQPIFDELCEEYKGKINCFEYNADSSSEIPRRYDIISYPAFAFFNNGEYMKEHKIKGFCKKEKFKKKIEKFLKDIKE